MMKAIFIRGHNEANMSFDMQP